MARRRFFRRRRRLRRRRFGRSRFRARRRTSLRRRRSRVHRRIPSNYAVSVTRLVYYRLSFQAPADPATNPADTYWFAHRWWCTPTSVSLAPTNQGTVASVNTLNFNGMSPFFTQYKFVRVRSISFTYIPSGNIGLSGDNTPVAGPSNTLLNRGNQIPTMFWYIDRSPNNAFLGSPDRAVFAGTGSSVTAPPYDTTQIRARSRRFARPIRVTIRRPSTIDYTGLLNADPPAGAFPGVSWADVGRNRWWSTSVLGVPPQVTVQNPNNLTYLGLKTGFWFNNPLYATYVNSSAALVRVPVLFNYTVQVRITNEFKHPW